MTQWIADGCHVFAGGFTYGVQEEMTVKRQYEIHGLGRETVQAQGIEFVETKTWEEWPDPTPGACLLFGNPRCTGFSCVTAGYDETAHGAWSSPTKDIHDLCNFGVKHRYPFICWESVQQAMSVGRELLDYLRDEVFVPNGYRIAHLLLNAATFGNSQHRKRYFFMAYPADLVFNVLPPSLSSMQHTTTGDIILNDSLLSRDTEPSRFGKHDEYHADCYMSRTLKEEMIIPYLPQGMDLNVLARNDYERLRKYSPLLADNWDERTSDMPFSMHSIMRLDPHDFCPVISGSAGRFVHPTLNRTLTMRELALLMGWPAHITPVGYCPVGQIGKGICPCAGTWLAQQVKLCATGYWDRNDWESSYDDKIGIWNGKYTSDAVEKTFDVTRFAPAKPIKREKEVRLAQSF